MSAESPVRGKSLRLKRPYLWTLYAVCGGVWLSGALWLIFHYFLRSRGQFGFRTHPLEPWWLALHGAFAAASAFMFGLLWVPHILAGWHMRWRRRSGGTLAGVTIWLILSGYALYYIGSKDLLTWAQILHWSIGLAALALFFIHWLSKSRPR